MRPRPVVPAMRGQGPPKEWRSPLGANMLEIADERIRSTREENAHGQVYRTGRARVKLHARRGESEREATGPPGRGNNAQALVGAIGAIAGRRHLCLEEGTLSGWLYEVPSPHVEELVVAGVSESQGSKNDRLDAFARAEQLRAVAARPSNHQLMAELVIRAHGRSRMPSRFGRGPGRCGRLTSYRTRPLRPWPDPATTPGRSVP
jgi:hypothetical protein